MSIVKQIIHPCRNYSKLRKDGVQLKLKAFKQTALLETKIWHDFLVQWLMEDKRTSDIVPEQQSGKAINAKSSVQLDSEKDAIEFFKIVKERLKNVNRWNELAGNLSAHFHLVDKEGMEIKRAPEKGDYFKIDIPGPGSKAGNGYDWVQIEDIESTKKSDGETFGLRVRPTKNPVKSSRDIAHFYSQESTSTFTVSRTGAEITAAIYDRNTKPNRNADSTVGKIRDAVVGSVGVISFSEIQWENLTEGLLKK